MPTPIVPVRLPLACNALDVDEVRDWLFQYVDQCINFEGQPRPAFHIVCRDHREEVELAPLAPQPGFDVATTWAAIAMRQDVEHALLVARFETDDARTLAVVMGVERKDGAITSWWAGLRGYEMTAEGVGTLTEEWWGVRGEGLPHEPFSMFTTPRPGAQEWPFLAAQPPTPDVRLSSGELPAEVRLPSTAMEMTELLAASTMPLVLRQGLDHVRVLCLRGRKFDLWEIHGGHLPSTLDDFIRYLCRHGGAPDVVGVACASVFEEDGRRMHAVQVTAERDGKRAERIVTFHKPDGSDKEVPSKTHFRELGAVGEGAGWIGVDPITGPERPPAS